MLAYLARRHTVATNASLAEVLGVSRPDSVPNLTRRFARWLTEQDEIRQRHKLLEDQLRVNLSSLSGEAATASSPSKWKAPPRACRQPISRRHEKVAVVTLDAIIQAPSRKYILNHYIWQCSATDRFMRISRAPEHNSMWTFNIR